jgi:hypothetical protein
MLSAWIAEQGLHCTMNIGIWESQGHNEAKAWGILLADVVRHIANAKAEQDGTTSEQTIEAIFTSLAAELEAPTSKAVGSFSHGRS